MWPLLVVVVLGVIQAATYFYGRTVIQSAAAACAEAARGLDAQPADGRRAAATVLESARGVTSTKITVSRTTSSATCHISGRPEALLDLEFMRVDHTASMPRERVTRP